MTSRESRYTIVVACLCRGDKGWDVAATLTGSSERLVVGAAVGCTRLWGSCVHPDDIMGRRTDRRALEEHVLTWASIQMPVSRMGGGGDRSARVENETQEEADIG